MAGNPGVKWRLIAVDGDEFKAPEIITTTVLAHCVDGIDAARFLAETHYDSKEVWEAFFDGKTHGMIRMEIIEPEQFVGTFAVELQRVVTASVHEIKARG